MQNACSGVQMIWPYFMFLACFTTLLAHCVLDQARGTSELVHHQSNLGMASFAPLSPSMSVMKADSFWWYVTMTLTMKTQVTSKPAITKLLSEATWAALWNWKEWYVNDAIRQWTPELRRTWLLWHAISAQMHVVHVDESTRALWKFTRYSAPTAVNLMLAIGRQQYLIAYLHKHAKLLSTLLRLASRLPAQVGHEHACQRWCSSFYIVGSSCRQWHKQRIL